MPAKRVLAFRVSLKVVVTESNTADTCCCFLLFKTFDRSAYFFTNLEENPPNVSVSAACCWSIVGCLLRDIFWNGKWEFSQNNWHRNDFWQKYTIKNWSKLGPPEWELTQTERQLTGHPPPPNPPKLRRGVKEQESEQGAQSKTRRRRWDLENQNIVWRPFQQSGGCRHTHVARGPIPVASYLFNGHQLAKCDAIKVCLIINWPYKKIPMVHLVLLLLPYTSFSESCQT